MSKARNVGQYLNFHYQKGVCTVLELAHDRFFCKY